MVLDTGQGEGARLAIGAAARACGISARMIRHYEAVGLLPAQARDRAGYRRYGAAELNVLRFVHRARGLGFALEEIGQLLALWHDRDRPSADVKALALRHVAALEAKAAALRAMGDTLRRLAESCHGDARPECPILDDLAGQAPPAPQSRQDGSVRSSRRSKAGHSFCP
jgi:Cu(I)-responsive transcriptional regulator